MRKKKFKSFAKINLFLNIGKKVNNTGLHNIQSLVFLINLFDEIKIKKNKSKTDKVKFYGKFCNKINKNNTITKSLYILRKKGFIDQNFKYDIKIKKQIPVFSGLGGGSSNAAYLIKNLVEKKKLTEKNKSIFSKHIGSDLKLFFYSNQIFQKKLYKITNLKSKVKIIGVGGVDSGLSAYNKFLSGADLIQLYTGMVYQGPNIVVKIKKELKELLINRGVKNFTEIIGKKN